MADTSRDRWRRRKASALSLSLAVLLSSCDRQAGPNAPTPPPPPTPPRSTGPIAFTSDRDGAAAIYLVNEDGSGVTKLAAGGGPAWSPNGRRIAFVSSDRALHVINVDGSGLQFVAGSAWGPPTWSPDGSTLVFATFRGGSEIDAVNVDGSNRRSLFDSGGYISGDPAWSPDGQRIVFNIGTFWDAEFGLWTVNADGSDARQLAGPGVGRPRLSFNALTSPFHDAAEAAWSPDGALIAFRSQKSSDFAIEVARLDGSGRHVRAASPAFGPDWTPDGRLIYTKGPFDGPTRIFINDGGTERQLIPEATAPARPTYSDWSAVWLR